ncbi:type II toxin-antitoxin system CcdA family antitoxin (plasmid) [Roseivivax marinus]|uniref:hypothetical protein n=1 Tax=Roseivivax marinus TaxID=1379903 RepID=UPI0012FE918B|nr:hypothetical protein [Roseivivax marinus]UMA67429.1 type II toxin-antitoxin system CcdA family antitoxin [Roseivivax marinus]
MIDDDERRRRVWLEENAQAFAVQKAWHEQHDHPLVEIMTRPSSARRRDEPT